MVEVREGWQNNAISLLSLSLGPRVHTLLRFAFGLFL